MTTLLFLLSNIFSTLNSTTSETLSQINDEFIRTKIVFSLDLNQNTTLLIREKGEKDIEFSLIIGEERADSLAWFRNYRISENLSKDILVDENSNYYIQIFDRTSTFGAQSVVVVSKEQDKWKLFSFPFIKVVPNKIEGKLILTEYYGMNSGKSFHFSNGKFIEVQ